jgi:segregation and condensation protein A
VGLERGNAFHPRDVTLEEPYAELVPDITLKMNLPDLLRAAGRVFEPKPQPVLDVSHVQPIRASVRDAILDMASLLRSGGISKFTELCATTERRIDVVVRFLGLLELFKAGAVELSQHQRFGDIEATWTGEVELEDILEDVEEYAVRPEGR